MTMVAISTPQGWVLWLYLDGGCTASSSSWSSSSPSLPPLPLPPPADVIPPAPPCEPEPLLLPPPLPLFLWVGCVWSGVVGGDYRRCGRHATAKPKGVKMLIWMLPNRNEKNSICGGGSFLWNPCIWGIVEIKGIGWCIPPPVWYRVLGYWLTGWWGGWTRGWTTVTRKPMLEMGGDQFGLECSWRWTASHNVSAHVDMALYVVSPFSGGEACLEPV